MDICNTINSSKLAWGLAALCANIGSRYVIQDITQAQERVLSHAIFKRFVVFCMIFIATRDVLLSVAITTLAWILLGHILNENSGYCIAPSICRHAPANATPTSQIQNPVSRQMYGQALDIVRHFQASPGR
jgi:hypothetical protein